MANVQRIALIIDGQDRILNGRDFPVINAATNTTVSTAQGATVEVAIEAVDSAQRAFPKWAAVKPQEKRLLLQKLGEVCGYPAPQTLLTGGDR